MREAREAQEALEQQQEEEEQAQLLARVGREPVQVKDEDDIPSIKSYHSSQEREKEKPVKQKASAQKAAREEELRAREEPKEPTNKTKRDRSE